MVAAGETQVSDLTNQRMKVSEAFRLPPLKPGRSTGNRSDPRRARQGECDAQGAGGGGGGPQEETVRPSPDPPGPALMSSRRFLEEAEKERRRLAEEERLRRIAERERQLQPHVPR